MPSHRRRFLGCSTCPDAIPPLRRRLAGATEPAFPVDIVYTWVDGSDAGHAAKRAGFTGGRGGPHMDGINPCRFRDNDELRYSLRSLEKFASWFNRVFIVTDAQTPAWLESENSRVTVVDHREIIPERFLPTFNSHVIESYLHHIPGLSEHYVYFNDDFFLANHCVKGDFFTGNGIPFVYCDWRKSRIRWYRRFRCPHAESYFTVLDLLRAGGLPAPELITAHAPYPMSRKCALLAAGFFEEKIASLSANRFRTPGDVAFYCHAAPLWGYSKRLVVPCDITYYYIYVKRPDRTLYYQAMLDENEREGLPLFLCLDDDADTYFPSGWKGDLENFLKSFLPEPSSFERRRDGGGDAAVF
ncbi:MAG: stealth family protein [Planctomycetes bacterium]|nr:stealth family protein [Planctomycetota bacterium]